MKKRGTIGLGILALTAALAAQTLGPQSLSAMKWRQIGPFRGGRVEAVAGVGGGSNVFYFGAVDGGVWKTRDAGTTWQPIFDHESTVAIGAIAVAPSDANVIYVGTGEPDWRGDITYGDGMYRSLDGGRTWQHIGLNDSRHIAKILVDPHNPMRVWVAALGHAFGPNPERGVFRSEDGGNTWTKTLYKDDRTGAVDLSFDGNNTHVIFAAMYQEQRTPWSYTSGGPGSGIYESRDDGATWAQLSGHGLPGGVLGRIGLAVSPANPDRIYALIQAKKGGLYESNDGGNSWQLATSDHRLTQRAWYFTRIFADPANAARIYVMNTGVSRSDDEGKTWATVRATHGDNHALWIDPSNPERMINGNDGGAAVTLDGGDTWSSEDNQPTGQFYHVATDNELFYHLYGAQQDLTTVAIASRTDHGSIGSTDWYAVGGGESGYVVPDPQDPNIVYAGSYLGMLTRFDRTTGQTHDISVWSDDGDGVGAKDLKYRNTWTMPIALSPQNPHVLYYGTQYVMRSSDQGQTWTAISPDLTHNDKSKQQISGGPIDGENSSIEVYDVVFTIAPSPRAAGVIWAGTDDGLVQLTRDNGQHWTNVTPPELPAWHKVSLIEASPFAAGTAYAAVNGFKLDDLAPYIYKTTDYGATWTTIVAGIQPGDFVRAVRADPVRQGLLYAGTEHGVYVSFNDGAQWQPLQLNLPPASVRDLAVHDGDLAAATHGRALWILDDLAPLRQMSAEDLAAPAHLFTPAPAYRFHGGGGFGGGGATAGANPPSGVILDYELQAAARGPVELHILDAQGKLVRSFTSQRPGAADGAGAGRGAAARLGNSAGLNRFAWDMTYDAPPPIPGASYDLGRPAGALALPGAYRAELSAGGQTYTAPVQIVPDPRVKAAAADLQRQFDLVQKIGVLIGEDHAAVNGMLALRPQLRELEGRAGNDPSTAAVKTAAEQLSKKLATIEAVFRNPEATTSEDFINYAPALNSKLAYLQSAVARGDGVPTAGQTALYEQFRGDVARGMEAWQQAQSTDLAQLNALAAKAGMGAVGLPAAEAATAGAPGRH